MGVQTGTTDLSICLPNKEVGRLPVKRIETGVGGLVSFEPTATFSCFFGFSGLCQSNALLPWQTKSLGMSWNIIFTALA